MVRDVQVEPYVVNEQFHAASKTVTIHYRVPAMPWAGARQHSVPAPKHVLDLLASHKAEDLRLSAGEQSVHLKPTITAIDLNEPLGVLPVFAATVGYGKAGGSPYHHEVQPMTVDQGWVKRHQKWLRGVVDHIEIPLEPE